MSFPRILSIRSGRLLSFLLISGAVVTAQLPQPQVITTWKGTVSSSWSTPGNWSNGVPNSTKTVRIPHTPVAPTTQGASSAACKSLSVAPTATLTIPTAFPLNVHSSVSYDASLGQTFGTVTGGGKIRMVGPGGINAPSGNLPNVEIAASPATSVTLAGQCSINGNLTLASGRLAIQTNANITISGDAQFLGGAIPNVWGYVAPGTLDVAGNVTFSGCAAPGKVNIRCAGDWTADELFTSGWGIVTLDGSAPTTLTATGPNATLYFNRLHIENGVRSLTSNVKILESIDPLINQSGFINIAAGAELAIADKVVDLNMGVTVRGKLSVAAGGQLGMSSLKLLQIFPEGTLRTVGLPGSPAAVRGYNGGNYTFVVQGRLEAMNFEYREMNSSGLMLQSTATLAPPPEDLRGGRFDFRPGLVVGGAWLLDVRIPSTHTYPLNLSYLTFGAPPPSVPFAYNVAAPSGAFVKLKNWDGVFGGESNDYDPGNRITWASPEVTTLSSFNATGSPGAVNLSWTSTLEVDTAMYVLERAAAPAGPFALLAEIPPVGPSSYAYSDWTAPPGQIAYYRLFRKLTHDAVLQLAAGSATATAATAPVITTQPSSPGNACVGEPAAMTVVATGVGLTYQWWKVGSPNTQVSGQTTATLNFPSVALSNAGQYFVIVSNPGGNTQSVTRSLNVYSQPVIQSQPVGATCCAGPSSTASFNVTATGSGLRYQWFRDGYHVGSNSATLNLTGVQPPAAGNYWCVVSNPGCVSAETLHVPLVVTTPVAITSQPTPQTSCNGGTATFTVGATGGALSYLWKLNGSPSIPGATNTTSSTLAVATPPGVAGNYHCEVTNPCGGPVPSAIVSLTVNPVGPPSIPTPPSSQSVLAGNPVTLSVGAFGGILTYQWRRGGVPIPGATASTFQIGSVMLEDAGVFDVVVTNDCSSLTSAPATLTVTSPPFFTQSPKSQILCLGEPVTFSVQVAGTGPITVDWERRSGSTGPFSPYGSPGTTLTISSMTAGDAGQYRARATGMVAPFTVSRAASLVAPIARATGAGPKDVAIGDVTAFGGPEVIAACSLADAVALHDNDGTGTFPTPPNIVSLSSGDEPVAVATGDLVPGGNLDIAVACAGSGVVRVLSGSSPVTFGVSASIAMPPSMSRPSSLAVANLDGGPLAEIVVGLDGGVLGQGGLAIIPNGGPTAFGLPTPTGGFGSIRAIALGDLDGDGDLDLAAATAHSVLQPASASKLLLYRQQLGTFTYVGGLAATQPRGVAIRDMNGDGRADVCVTVESYPTLVPGGLHVFLHDAANGMEIFQFTSAPVLSSGLVPSDLVAADLRDDGVPGYIAKTDVVTLNLGSGDLTFHEVFNGTGFDTTRFCSAATNPVATAVGDLNGDFTSDLVVANYSSGDITIFPMPPDPVVQTFGAGCPGSTGMTPTLSVIGDPLWPGTITLRISGLVPGSAPMVFSSPTTGVGSPIGSSCAGYLLPPVSPVFLTPVGSISADGMGRLVLSGPIPGGVLGATVYFQVVVPSVPLTAATGGLRIKVGF